MPIRLLTTLAIFTTLFWAIPAYIMAEAWWFPFLYNNEGTDDIERIMALFWFLFSAYLAKHSGELLCR